MATASAVAQPREKIRFDYGRTETVVLKFGGQGKEVPGIYGAQFMFSTADDRVFFVDHDIAYQIEKCPGAANGEPISITRSKGPRNTTSWDIRPAVAPVVSAPPASELEAKLEQSIAHVHQVKAMQATRAEATGQQPILTQAKSTGQALSPDKSTDGRMPVVGAQAKLLAALCVAIDSCVEAKAYAQRRGLPLEFSGEDVRCFANCLMISAERQIGGAR